MDKGKTVIYEDDHHRVIYKNNFSKKIVLVFPDSITVADDIDIWAEAPLDKLNLSSICFMPKAKARWFTSKSIKESKEKINEIIKGYTDIIGFGSSMGGYGAIKYSKLFNMSKVISITPQYSIVPSEAPFDKKRHQFYKEDLHKDMRIKGSDINNECLYLIVYDPMSKVDSSHVNSITKGCNISTLNFLYCYNVGHGCMNFLKGSGMLHKMFENKKNDIITEIRERKRKSPKFLKIIFRKSIERHPQMITKIIKQRGFENKLRDQDKQLYVHSSMKLVSKENEIDYLIDKSHILDCFNKTLAYNRIAKKIESFPLSDIIFNDDIYLIEGKKGNAYIKIGSEKKYLHFNENATVDYQDSSYKTGCILILNDGDELIIKETDSCLYLQARKDELTAFTSVEVVERRERFKLSYTKHIIKNNRN